MWSASWQQNARLRSEYPCRRAQIENLIQAGIPDAKVTVSGGEGKFEATVISSAFEGLMPVKRHQLVYATVREQIADGSLHALSIRPLTPDEHEKSR